MTMATLREMFGESCGKDLFASVSAQDVGSNVVVNPPIYVDLWPSERASGAFYLHYLFVVDCFFRCSKYK
jgi:hypothetical protein